MAIQIGLRAVPVQRVWASYRWGELGGELSDVFQACTRMTIWDRGEQITCGGDAPKLSKSTHA
jgi:hypothetical protein